MLDGMMLEYNDGLIVGCDDIINDGLIVGSPGFTDGLQDDINVGRYVFKIEGDLIGFFEGLAKDGTNDDDEVGFIVRILLGLSVEKAVEAMVDFVLGFKELGSEGPWLGKSIDKAVGKWLGLTVDIRLGSTIGAELEDIDGNEDEVIIGLGEKLVCIGDGTLLVNGDGVNVGTIERFRLDGT